MNMKFVVIGIAVLLIGAGVFFFTQQKPDVTSTTIAASADVLKDVEFYKELYPESYATLRKEGCIDPYMKYLQSTETLRVNRDSLSCQPKTETDFAWVVEYKVNRSNIQGTIPALVVAYDKKGKFLDSAFTSPFDDVYLLRFDGSYGTKFLQSIGTDKIKVGNAWGVFDKDNVQYSFFTSDDPIKKKTDVQLFISKYNSYGLATSDKLKQDITESHRLLRSGADEIAKSLKENLGVTPSELYYAVYP